MIRDRDRHARTAPREVALDCVEAGIDAAHPRTVVRERLDYDGDADRLTVDGRGYDLDGGPLYVVGGGNAAGAAATALEALLGDRVTAGAVVTDDPRHTDAIETLPGDHPVPSERGAAGADRVRTIARGAGANATILAVIGGGGSALLPAPVDGVSLSALGDLTESLLASGAPIAEINAVRKHLSAIKGGRLAATAAPARVIGLAFSDVVGDDLAAVASGPTAPDPTTYEDAIAALERHGVEAAPAIRSHLEAGAAGDHPETPDADDPIFDAVSNHVLTNGTAAIKAAAAVARDRGYAPLVLSTRMRGESRETATAHVAIAEECLAAGRPIEPPAVLLSGGETTVTLRGDGRGGPNQEFALSGALALDDEITMAAVDTDGRDGATDAAGALVDGTTVDDPRSAERALDANDAYSWLADRDALLFTGDTGTNVNDLRAIVVE